MGLPSPHGTRVSDLGGRATASGAGPATWRPGTLRSRRTWRWWHLAATDREPSAQLLAPAPAVPAREAVRAAGASLLRLPAGDLPRLHLPHRSAPFRQPAWRKNRNLSDQLAGSTVAGGPANLSGTGARGQQSAPISPSQQQPAPAPLTTLPLLCSLAVPPARLLSGPSATSVLLQCRQHALLLLTRQSASNVLARCRLHLSSCSQFLVLCRLGCRLGAAARTAKDWFELTTQILSLARASNSPRGTYIASRAATAAPLLGLAAGRPTHSLQFFVPSTPVAPTCRQP